MKPLPQLLLLTFLLSVGKTALAADSLSLWEAMERAAQSNPAIKSQQVEVDRQTLEQDIARGQRLPKVDLDAAYMHHGYPSLITPIREAGVFPPMDRDIANIGVALNLPLYRGGKLVAGEALAAHNREVSVQSLRAGGQDLLFNVAATYTKALHFRQLVNVLDARIKALQQEGKDIELRIQEGRAARLELIRLQTQLSQARYDRVSVVQGERDALSLLAALLGTGDPVPTLVGVGSALPEEAKSIGDDPAVTLVELGASAPLLPVSIDEAMRRALQRRPDLLRLDAMGRAAEQKTAIARGERLPQIDLVARAQESTGSDWEGYDDWQLGVQLFLPVFDGGIRKRRVEQAGLEQRQNALQQEDAHNRIASEIEQAFGALSESRARLEAAAQGEIEASEALRIETLRYHSGENTITDLLGAESALWSATASRLQAGYDITVSQARLLHATGELTPDSFKPAGDNTKREGTLRSSAIDTGSLAHYLAWHASVTTCEGDTAPPHTTASAFTDKTFTAKNLAGHAIQQGARL